MTGFLKTDRSGNFLKSLAAYYGIIQAVHFFALLYTLSIFLRDNSIGFLAPPPAGGWSSEAKHFLMGLGLVDGANCILAVIFVIDFFTHKSGAGVVGIISLTVAVTTALIYGYATMMNSAWITHPWQYILIAVLWIPVPVFLITFSLNYFGPQHRDY